jgi:NAD-dependent deacetylase
MEDIYVKLNQIMKDAKRITFFGGAGVSTNSGLLDFRSKQGLYNLKTKYGRAYEEMLSIDYFLENTETFYKFYKEFMIKPEVIPNNAHKALAIFDEKYNNINIVTQNIDNLHQLAGSKKVIEIHGSIYRNYCRKCYKRYDGIESIIGVDGVPKCSCGGVIRPDVTLYGEGLNGEAWNDAVESISNSDVLIVGGTSLNVYPAVNLIRYFKGRVLIIINKEKTKYDYIANYVFNEDIAEVLEKILSL